MLTETTGAIDRPLMETPGRASDHRILIEFHKPIIDYEKNSSLTSLIWPIADIVVFLETPDTYGHA